MAYDNGYVRGGASWFGNYAPGGAYAKSYVYLNGVLVDSDTTGEYSGIGGSMIFDPGTKVTCKLVLDGKMYTKSATARA